MPDCTLELRGLKLITAEEEAPEKLVRVCKILYDNGVRILEITTDNLPALILLDYLSSSQSLQDFGIVCQAAIRLIPPDKLQTVWPTIHLILIQLRTERACVQPTES
jgi:hypothetical protein